MNAQYNGSFGHWEVSGRCPNGWKAYMGTPDCHLVVH